MARALTETDTADAALLGTVAQRTEHLTRAAQTARVVSARLQNALLPPLPEIAGCALDVAYRTASAHMEVGGDFYDVLALPDERELAFASLGHPPPRLRRHHGEAPGWALSDS